MKNNSLLDAALVTKAMAPTPWDLGNQVLYDLCREHPGHTEEQAVIAKILLIGRTYAASIERRKGGDDLKGDRFYLQRVVPTVLTSDLDEWLSEARASEPGTPRGIETLVKVHDRTMKLFQQISGLENRSLASKYLHFHVPRLFCIFDARATAALRKLNDELPRSPKHETNGDPEYGRFVERCEALRKHCDSKLQLALSPRQLDNLLLRVHESNDSAPSE
ncbi:MAG: hypothetical protein U0939_22245 [Pirellulales bacterium]